MIDNIPRISVRVITYNQEDTISRAIESLLSQKDYIYEICVSDDCSKDRTWEILQDYSRKHPNLFKLNRNEPNLGMFENIEKTWDMASGDVICCLAGDDECGAGWLEKVIGFIQDNKLDYKNDAFCIYGDYIALYPNQDNYIYSNRLVTKHNALKLGIRGLIGNRSCCYSSAVLKKFVRVSKGKSYVAEPAQDRQVQMFADRNYYIPYVGNIYYARIGVSMHFTKKDKEEREERLLYLKEVLDSQGITLDNKDIAYINYKVACEKNNRLQAWHYYFKSIDLSLGFHSLMIRRKIFALLRRIPHSNPISYFKVN
jgi:glycosyltransferase involved in cell wall biosynthesis